MDKKLDLWKIGKILGLVLALVAVLAIPVSAESPVPLEVEVFLQDGGIDCSACPDPYLLESEIIASVNRLFAPGIDEEQIIFSFFNLNRRDEFNTILSYRALNAGVDEETIEMPAFFTADNYYFGGPDALEQLRVHAEGLGIAIFEEQTTTPRQIPYMPEDAVVEPRHDDPYNVSINDSVVVYFYTPWCPFCYEIAPIMSYLPEYVIIDGQKSYVRMISFNRDIPEHHAVIRAYHELLQIPDERRFVPLVLVGDRDLFLYDEVSQYLIPALEAGEGLITPLFTQRIVEPESTSTQMIWPMVLIGAIIVAITFYWLGRRKS